MLAISSPYGGIRWAIHDSPGAKVGFYNDAVENMNILRGKTLLWKSNKLEKSDPITAQYKQIQSLSLLSGPKHLGGVRAAFKYSGIKGNSIHTNTPNTPKQIHHLTRLLKHVDHLKLSITVWSAA